MLKSLVEGAEGPGAAARPGCAAVGAAAGVILASRPAAGEQRAVAGPAVSVGCPGFTAACSCLPAREWVLLLVHTPARPDQAGPQNGDTLGRTNTTLDAYFSKSY